MTDGDAVREIVAATGCTVSEAAEAYRAACGDAGQAIARLRGAAPRAAKIAKYANGLLVEDRFYDYALRENRELLRMLERGEFDREVLGLDSDEAYVVMEEHDGAYPYDLHAMKDGLGATSQKRVKADTQEGHRLHAASHTEDLQLSLPETVDLTRPGCETVCFRLCSGLEISTFLVPDTVLIKDILDYLFAHTGRVLRLARQGRVLDGEGSVLTIRRCMVDAVL